MAGEPPSDSDDALLARLNALKQSSVKFAGTNERSITGIPSESRETPEDLVARFQDLHGKNATADREDRTLRDKDGPSSPTIEELLAELGPEDRYTFGDTDLKEANQLLAEARHTLPKPEPSADRVDQPSFQSSKSIEQDPEAEAEAEAESSLQHILDEMEIEKQDASILAATSPQHDTTPALASEQPDSFASLIFPSTPHTALPSLDLPSAPTAAPSARKLASRQKGFSDEEIDSWCIICCANATVRCYGCDKDLYCWSCWREGHVGEDVGLEEKSHTWYVPFRLIYLAQNWNHKPPHKISFLAAAMSLYLKRPSDCDPDFDHFTRERLVKKTSGKA